MTELEELRDEIRKLREEVAALRMDIPHPHRNGDQIMQEYRRELQVYPPIPWRGLGS